MLTSAFLAFSVLLLMAGHGFFMARKSVHAWVYTAWGAFTLWIGLTRVCWLAADAADRFYGVMR
jgi:hypothetical protein